MTTINAATPVDPVQDWLFNVNSLGPFAACEEIAALIEDSPDPDHPEVAYMRAVLDARFIASLRAA